MNAIGTTISMFVIDGMGRRSVMLTMLPGCAIALVGVAISMYLSDQPDGTTSHTIGNILAMVGLLAYLAFFSIGMSSTPWSVNTEIYPIHLISSASALSTATNWLSNFIVSSSFLTLMNLGDYGKELSFSLLAIACVIAWIFINCLLPETNGRPIPLNVNNILEGRIVRGKPSEEELSEYELVEMEITDYDQT